MMKNDPRTNRSNRLFVILPATVLVFLILIGMLSSHAQAQGGGTLETWRISVAYDGGNANSNSWFAPSLSYDGRFVAFFSQASNLVPPGQDTNGWDIFVRDQLTGTIRLADVAENGEQSNENVNYPLISADGRYVAFVTGATNLGPGSDFNMSKVYLKDLLTEKVYLVSHSYDGTPLNWASTIPSMSADGRYVTFSSSASNVVPFDDNFHCASGGGSPSGKCIDVYVWDRLTDQVKKVSVDSVGRQANQGSDLSSISPDGRYITFYSRATNLLPDFYRPPAIYLHDLQTGTTSLLAQTDSNAVQSAFSYDGRYIAFVSTANDLVPNDKDFDADVFVYDQQSGQIELISLSSAETPGNAHSDGPLGMSWDGRYVIFSSTATNLVTGDTNGVKDIFLRDRQTGETTRVSVATDNSEGNDSSYEGGISGDGRFMAFSSGSSNLVPDDTGAFDMFVRALPIEANTWATITPTPVSPSQTPVATMTLSPTALPTRTRTPSPTPTATNVLVWNSTLVQTTGTPAYQGYQLDMDLDSTDKPHMSYLDFLEVKVKHVYWTGSQWLTDVIGNGISWEHTYPSLNLDSNDRPHVSYFGTNGLNHTYWDGSQWQSSVPGNSGRYDALIVDSTGNAHISFCDNQILKYTHWNGASWDLQVVDNVNGCNSGSQLLHETPISLVLDADGKPHIVYVTAHAADFVPIAGNFQLRHAWWDGAQWNSELIHAGKDRDPSLVFDSQGQPHVSFCHDWSLMYASKSGASWTVETVDRSTGEWPDYQGWVCGTTSLALDGNDRPRIVYWRVGVTDGYVLRYASWNGTQWLLDSVEARAVWASQQYRVLGLDSLDLPHIAYYNNNDTVGLAPGLYYASGSVRVVPPSGTPSIPMLQSPANNALLTHYTPTINWSDATPGLDHYRLQLDDNADFSSPLVDDNTLTSSQYVFVSPLPANVKFYWRVRAANSIDGTKGWSTVWSFRTAIQPTNLSSPNDLQILDHRRPWMDWQDVNGATGYKLVISKNANLSSPILSVSIVGSSFTPVSDLPAKTKLYWRVQATGPNGPSLWSDTRSFTTGNPPSVPPLQAPANNALTTIGQPLFNWGNSTLPATTTFKYYQIQLDDDVDFSSTFADAFTTLGQLDDSDFVPSSVLAPNTKYYWRVRSINADSGVDQFSAWSSVWTQRSAMLPPVLASPAHLQGLSDVRPTFDWNNASGATGYKLVVSKNSNLSSPIKSVTTVDSAYAFTSNLPAGTTLFWRVQSTGPNGPSLWSNTWSFTTGKPPSIPVLVSPAANALVLNSSVPLNWNTSSLPAGTTFKHYQVQVQAGSSDFSVPLLDVTTTVGDITDSDYIANLSPNAVYYWRVRAVGLDGLDEQFSAWSLVRSLRVALAAPVLLSPANDSVNPIGTSMPIFTWDPVSGAGGYTIQISTSASFATLLVNASAGVPEYPTTKNLPAAKILYWRVRANGPNGPSAWSLVFQFKTP